MSAFAALAGFDGGDENEIKEAQRAKAREDQAVRQQEVEAAQRAFADFKAKAGQSNWADDDEEDEFLSLPVRNRANRAPPPGVAGRLPRAPRPRRRLPHAACSWL